jgi:hypothetical protein
MTPASIDKILSRFKNYGPYGTIMGMALIGMGMYRLGGSDDIPAILVRWSGALMCFCSVVALALWHFLGWPPWLANSNPKGKK